MGQSLKNALEVAAGVSLAGLFDQAIRGAVDFTKHLVSVGLEAQRQEQVFERFTQAIGVNANALTAAMETAGRGLVDVGETMVAQQQLLKAGFQPEQIVGLMEAAFARAAASGQDVTEVFNQMGTAIAQAKAKGVEATGVIIDQEAAMDAYATSIGKAAKDLTEAEKAQATYLATMKSSAGEIKQFGDAQLNLSQMFTLVKVQLGEFIEGIGVGLVNGIQTAVTWVMSFKDQWIALGQSLAAFASGIGTQLKASLAGVWEGLKALADIIGPILLPLLQAMGQFIGGALVAGLLALQAALTVVVPPLVYMASIAKDLASGSLPDLEKANTAATASMDRLRAGLVASATAAGQMAGVIQPIAAESEKAAVSTGKLGKNLTDVGQAAGPSAAELKKAADEAKKLAEQAERGAIALVDFQQKLANMATPADTLAKKLAEIDKEVASNVKQFPMLAAEFQKTGDEMKALVTETDRLVKAWEAMKDLPQDLAEDFNAFDVAMLKVSLDTKKVVDGLAGVVVEGDKFGFSLQEGGRKLIGFDQAFPGVIERTERLGIALKTITPEMEDMANAADDATPAMHALAEALLFRDIASVGVAFKGINVELLHMAQVADLAAIDMAILADSMEPILEAAEDQRWAAIGKSIESAFLTVTDTFTKVVNGVLQGTIDIGDAFEDLGLKLLENFNQFALHTIFDPFLEAAASFATDLARALDQGDWSKVGDVVADRLAGTPLGMLFGIEAAPSGTEGLLKEGAQFESVDVFSIKNLLSAQTIIAGIAIMVNAISQMAQGKVATGIGTLVGGIVGGVVGGFATGGNPAGIAVGAGAGSAVGGMIGGLFEEDYAALRRIRTQQRQRTSQAALEDTRQDMMMADDLGELAQQLRKSMAGTLSSQGGVLLSMLQDSRTKFADVSAAEAARVQTFLTEQGFRPEQFAQGRVGSVAELFAGAPQEWEALIEALSQFLEILEKTYGTVLPKLESLSREDFTKSKALFEALDTALRLEELGFEEAGEKIRERLRTMIAQFGDAAGVLAEITENAFKQVQRDPTQLLRFANVTQWQRAGEDIDDTTERLTASLELVGETMASMSDELLALNPPLYAALINVQDVMTEFADADWAGIAEAMQSADPSDWGAAIVEAHDLLMARYEAEIRLIQVITAAIGQLFESANALVGTAARLQDLGILPSGGMELASSLATRGAEAVGTFRTPEMNLVAGRGAVDLFAQQSQMAARSMNLDALEATMMAAGDLVAGFTATIDQINKIEDPSERMRLLTEVLVQTGDAAAAAAEAAITYWQTLHDTVAAMIDQLNGIASQIAASGNALASNADWLIKAGVDVPALANQMLDLINLFPTMGAKLDLLGSGIQLFVAGISETEMERLTDLAKQFEGAAGTPAQAGIMEAVVQGLQPVLEGFVNTFTAAMALQDPGQRLAALTAILEQLGGLLGSLPPEMADALVKMFGPEIQILVAEIQAAAAAQAAQAALIAAELKGIIGDKALSPENFLLLTVKGIEDALNIIILGAKPLFDLIVQSMEAAGGDIGAAIIAAGNALDAALEGFETPAAQLVTALNSLRDTMGKTMYDAVKNAIDAALGAETGMTYVPKTGIYKLHQGEGVLTAEENALFQSGGLGSFQTGTGSFGAMLRAVVSAMRDVPKEFQDVGALVVNAFKDAGVAATDAFKALLQSNDDLSRLLNRAVGGAAEILGSVGAMLGSAWTSLPAMLTDAVNAGISAALTAHGLQTGTPYVARTGLHLLHQGEAVIPAWANHPAGRRAARELVNLTINIAGHATREDAQYIAKLVQRELRSGPGRVMVERIQRSIR